MGPYKRSRYPSQMGAQGYLNLFLRKSSNTVIHCLQDRTGSRYFLANVLIL